MLKSILLIKARISSCNTHLDFQANGGTSGVGSCVCEQMRTVFKINTVRNLLGTTKSGGASSEASPKTWSERAVSVLYCQDNSNFLELTLHKNYYLLTQAVNRKKAPKFHLGSFSRVSKENWRRTIDNVMPKQVNHNRELPNEQEA